MRRKLVASFTIQMIQIQKEHGVPPNKHYEIPFVKEYAMGFPLLYSVKAASRLHSVTSDVL